MTYATCPNGGANDGQTTTVPGAGTSSTCNDARRATFGQFQAFIAPGTNQSMRWWLATNAHATYDVQLHAYIPQRSTTCSRSPRPGTELRTDSRRRPASSTAAEGALRLPVSAMTPRVRLPPMSRSRPTAQADPSAKYRRFGLCLIAASSRSSTLSTQMSRSKRARAKERKHGSVRPPARPEPSQSRSRSRSVSNRRGASSGGGGEARDRRRSARRRRCLHGGRTGHLRGPLQTSSPSPVDPPAALSRRSAEPVAGWDSCARNCPA